MSVLVLILLCFALSTEARVVTNEGIKQLVGPSETFLGTNGEPKPPTHIHDTNNEPKPPTHIHDTNTEPEPPTDIHDTNNEPKPPTHIHDTNNEPEPPSHDHSMQSRSEQHSNDANTWCIAKPTTDEQRLEASIEFSCSQRYVSVDCKLIQPGGPCYNPNNKYSHASAVMNSYYKASNQQPHNCDFQGTGLIITQDPSGGSCKYK